MTRPRRAARLLLALVVALGLAVAVAPETQAAAASRVTLSGGVFLRVDVNPNLSGSKSWTFVLQRRTASGSWTKVGTYRTQGRAETRDLAVGAGVYRVKVKPRGSGRTVTSKAFRYTPTATVRLSGGSALRVDVDPALPGSAGWPVSVQRLAAGSWTTVARTTTVGTDEVATVPVPSGTYRAVVGPAGRFPATTSRSYAVVDDPSAAGAFAVARSTTTVARGARSIGVTAYLPAAADGSAPLVLLLPAFQVPTSAYEATAAHLARHGFAVVLVERDGLIFPTHTADLDDVIAVIDWATGAGGPAVVNDSSIAVAGHSLGGKIATMVALADPRVDALYGIDPVDGGLSNPDIVPSQTGGLTIPVGFIGETLDSTGGAQPCAPAADNYAQFYAGTTGASSAVQWTAAGASHFSFTDSAVANAQLCATATADRATVLAALRTTLTAFASRHLRGDTSQEPWLTGARVPSILAVDSRSGPVNLR